MTFVDHGIQGGLYRGLLTKAILIILSLIFGTAVNPLWILVAFTLGFIIGSWPDVGDWVYSKIGHWPRWYWYGIFHHQITEFDKFTEFRMHKMVDVPFHTKPENVSQEDWDNNVNKVRNWWPRMWKLACFWWGLEICGLVLLFY
jgi:hypothetical protein